MIIMKQRAIIRYTGLYHYILRAMLYVIMYATYISAYLRSEISIYDASDL